MEALDRLAEGQLQLRRRKPLTRLQVVMGMGAFLAVAEAYNGAVTASVQKAKRCDPFPPSLSGMRSLPTLLVYQQQPQLTQPASELRVLAALLSYAADGQSGFCLRTLKEPPPMERGCSWRLPNKRKEAEDSAAGTSPQASFTTGAAGETSPSSLSPLHPPSPSPSPSYPSLILPRPSSPVLSVSLSLSSPLLSPPSLLPLLSCPFLLLVV